MTYTLVIKKYIYKTYMICAIIFLNDGKILQLLPNP
jgi:hypothetical protein